MALTDRLDMDALDALPLDPLTKGLPFDAPPLRVGEVGAQGWSVLAGDLPLPVAVVREAVLKANSAWMAAFAAENGLLLAPHGKTTMAPALFDLQIADGAWAITVATIQQMQVCRRFGAKRVLLANQPVGRQAIDACFAALADPGFELYCLVDGREGLAMLAEGAVRAGAGANPLRVLIEMGFEGGRTGARSVEAGLALARQAAETPGLVLAGFECFEGLKPTTEGADALVDAVTELAERAIASGLFAEDSTVVLSAGGSAFFDRVGERLGMRPLGRPVQRVLRSGCYLTHDCLSYAAAYRRIRAETTLKLPPGGLEPALEVWALVQSRPEPGRAILTMGKRDAGFDAGMPVPLRWYRAGMTGPTAVGAGFEVVALNDQHCHLALPPESPLAVGDMMGFGIGHPCTTFDKWAMLLGVDEDYRVTRALKTFF